MLSSSDAAATSETVVSSCSHIPCAAVCRATSADEHAVSIVAHGPCKPRAYESRPEATEVADEVAAYTGGGGLYRAGSRVCIHTSDIDGRLRSNEGGSAAARAKQRRKPHLSSILWWGSMLAASAIAMPNAVRSNRSIRATHPQLAHMEKARLVGHGEVAHLLPSTAL